MHGSITLQHSLLCSTTVTNEKSARRDANTARWLWWGRAKNFCPATEPLPGGTG